MAFHAGLGKNSHLPILRRYKQVRFASAVHKIGQYSKHKIYFFVLKHKRAAIQDRKSSARKTTRTSARWSQIIALRGSQFKSA